MVYAVFRRYAMVETTRKYYAEEIAIRVPDGFTRLISRDKTEMEHDVCISLAIKYYLEERISIGKAAQLAHMDKIAFENYLSRHHIPISLLTYDDVMQELATIENSGTARA
jgi:predicted HTH domain antitoxin